MAAGTMNSFIRFGWLVPALGLAACSPAAPERGPLDGATIGGPFQLVNQDGRQVTQQILAGKYAVVYFGYTFCPDVCPVDARNIGAGLRLFEQRSPERAAKVVPVFVSVDPARDTPPIVKAFVGNFHPRFIGLTGSPEAIAKTAKDYAIFYQKVQPEGAGGYLVNHSRQAYLMGADGKPIALVPAEESPEKVAEALDRWVK